MRNSAAFRLVSHICFFYSVAVLVPQFRLPNNTAYFIIAASALIACCAAVYLEHAALRLIVSLIPLAVLSIILKPAAVTAVLIVNALPLVYAAVFLVLGRFHGEVLAYRSEIRLLIVFILPLLALTIYYQTSFMTDAAQIDALSYAWLFYALFVLLAFLSLRTMRSGAVRSAKWQAGTIGFYLLAVAFAAFAGYLVRFAVPVFKFIVMLLFLPIALIFWLISMAFSAFVTSCGSHLGDFLDTVPPITLYPGEQAAPAPVSIATPPPSNFLDDFGKGFGFSHKAVMIGIIVLLAAVVLMILLTHTGKLTKSAVSQVDREPNDDPSSIKRAALKKLRRKTPATNAERVREAYSRYLRFLKRSGIERHPGSTSEEISEKAEELLDKPDELLRELYIKARYSGAELTDEDAEAAEEAYLRLVNAQSRIDRS